MIESVKPMKSGRGWDYLQYIFWSKKYHAMLSTIEEKSKKNPPPKEGGGLEQIRTKLIYSQQSFCEKRRNS